MPGWVAIVVSLLVLVTAGPIAGSTPESPSEQVSDFVHSGTPILNGGVMFAWNGDVSVSEVSGMADFATRRPNRPDAVFQLASAAKPFTSVALLQLRDAGALRLEDPVDKYLPGFPYPDIRVRHLLSHTSGLPDLELFEPLIAERPDHVVGGDDLIPSLMSWKQPLRFKAGDQFRYSNINYQLLARIVERTSGMAFGEYVKRRIFRPAGMRSSYVLGSRAIGNHRDPVSNQVLAVMYRTVPEDVRRLSYPDARMMRPYRYEGYNLGSTVGDQNVFSSLDDLRRFDIALRQGRVLGVESQEEAYAPIHLNDGSVYEDEADYVVYGARCSYGLGWETCQHPMRGRLVGHAGYNRGIVTILYRGLDDGMFAAMYDNGDTGDFAKKFASLVNIMNRQSPVDFPRQRSIAREYGKKLVDAGPTAALILYNRLKADTANWLGTAAGINRLGYDLLRNGHAALAIDPFLINVVLAPDDANAYAGLAEALAANGRKAEAIAAYSRSLELDPENKRNRELLKVLEAESN